MEANGVGFFGKLPTLGDFVSRRLPRHFVEPWDNWLQASIKLSQDIHGENWLSLFLVSPIWRFSLSPGLCGNQAWAGIFMPSVDRVGRYYPLTLAQEIPAEQVSDVFCCGSKWFVELENAALSALSEQFDIDSFNQRLLNIHFPPAYTTEGRGIDDNEKTVNLISKPAYRFDLNQLADAEQAFPHLTRLLLNRFLPTYSFWAAEGIEENQASFFCCEGMPPIDAYADFLSGVHNNNSKTWQCHTHKLILPKYQRQSDRLSLSPNQAHFENIRLWQSFGITEVGNRRKHNEDAMLNAPELGLWVVADGMGGHQFGDAASQKIVEVLADLPLSGGFTDQVNWISDQLQLVNHSLCAMAKNIGQGAVIGSTVVSLFACADQCAVIWAGDSRLYQLRNGQLKQLTRDHTLLDELINTTNMSREAALQQVGANVITRAVGGQAILDVDVIFFQAEKGDRYLLCSDGLDKEVNDEEITYWLSSESCHLAVEGLINLALSRNGIDNITVLVADFNGLS